MSYTGIFSAPSYGMGDGDTVAPMPDSAKVAKAKRNIDRMTRSLKSWLKFRKRMDLAAAGVTQKVLPTPGQFAVAPEVLQQTMLYQRFEAEQPLALELSTLLKIVYGNDAKLPDPRLDKNPNAAEQLAEIAIRGKIDEAVASPQSVGLLPVVWGIIAITGAVGFTAITAVRSWADVAKERERIACITAGACTDSGFWLKMGIIGVGGYFIYNRYIKKKSSRQSLPRARAR